MTKQQERMYTNFTKATATCLREVYKAWSAEKELAFNRCFTEYNAMDGIAWRICSANTYDFVFAFTYPHDDGTVHLRYHTSQNVYDFSTTEIWRA